MSEVDNPNNVNFSLTAREFDRKLRPHWISGESTSSFSSLTTMASIRSFAGSARNILAPVVLEEREIGMKKRRPTNSLGTPIFDLDLLQPVGRDFESNLKNSSFTEVHTLCHGSRSEIFQGLYKSKPVIVKVVSDVYAEDQIAINEFNREVSVLSHLSHPHILDIYGTGEFSNVTGIACPLMVLECLQGHTLKYHLTIPRTHSQRPFTELRYLRMAREFADALSFLHEKVHPNCVMIHRDLKPDNVGFTIDGTLKLLDFGLCIYMNRGMKQNEKYHLTGCTGSLRYMAPEVALNHNYNEKVDIYSYGIILYEMVTGVSPFKGLSREEFIEKVAKAGLRPDLHHDEYYRAIKVNDDIRSLIDKCWSASIELRPTASEVFELVANVEKSVEEIQLKNPLKSSIKRLVTKRDSI